MGEWRPITTSYRSDPKGLRPSWPFICLFHFCESAQKAVLFSSTSIDWSAPYNVLRLLDEKPPSFTFDDIRVMLRGMTQAEDREGVPTWFLLRDLAPLLASPEALTACRSDLERLRESARGWSTSKDCHPNWNGPSMRAHRSRFWLRFASPMSPPTIATMSCHRQACSTFSSTTRPKHFLICMRRTGVSSIMMVIFPNFAAGLRLKKKTLSVSSTPAL